MRIEPLRRRTLTSFCVLLAWLCSAPGFAAGWPTDQPARPADARSAGEVLSAAAAGDASVSVGRHGLILRSEDGRVFRQAGRVPTRSTLTSVSFADADHGWAVGYDGLVLHTRDGGRTWVTQRERYGSDEVLLAVSFESRTHGIAVGLFGLMLETFDGGASWAKRALPQAEVSDAHLYSVVRFGGTGLLITAEGGRALRSTDGGASWQLVQTGVKASLWAGAAHGRQLVAAGLRGTVISSNDAGLTWQRLASGTTSAVTAVAFAPNGLLYLGTADGTLLTSSDGGRSFSMAKAKGDEAITAIANRGPGVVVLPLRQ